MEHFSHALSKHMEFYPFYTLGVKSRRINNSFNPKTILYGWWYPYPHSTDEDSEEELHTALWQTT